MSTANGAAIRLAPEPPILQAAQLNSKDFAVTSDAGALLRGEVNRALIAQFLRQQYTASGLSFDKERL